MNHKKTLVIYLTKVFVCFNMKEIKKNWGIWEEQYGQNRGIFE